jgi:hypothetical protein
MLAPTQNQVIGIHSCFGNPCNAYPRITAKKAWTPIAPLEETVDEDGILADIDVQSITETTSV